MIKDKKMWVACDIDHSVSDARWRDGMAGIMDDVRSGWDEYNAAAADDRPIPEVIELLRSLHRDGWGTIGLTARPIKWKSVTQRWLLEHDVPFDELLMRAHEDFRPAPMVKLSLLSARFGSLSDIKLVIDDRSDIVSAFVEMGITALQVHARTINERSSS